MPQRERKKMLGRHEPAWERVDYANTVIHLYEYCMYTLRMQHIMYTQIQNIYLHVYTHYMCVCVCMYVCVCIVYII